MSVAALSPVRVWSSVGRPLSGSSGLATAPIGKMNAEGNTCLIRIRVSTVASPKCSVRPAPTRDSVASVTRERKAPVALS